MHKLLAIFLAIGAVNAAVAQNGETKPYSTTLQVEDANGEVLKYFGISNGATSAVEIKDIVAELQQFLSNNGDSTTVGSALDQLTKSVYNSVDLTQSNIKPGVSNFPLDLQSIINYLSQYDGSLTLENFLVVLTNIVDGLQNALSESGSATTQGVFDEFVSSNNLVTYDEIRTLFEQLSNNGVQKLGEGIIELGKRLGVTITEADIDSNIYNLPVDFSSVLSSLNGQSGSTSISDLFKLVVSTIPPYYTYTIDFSTVSTAFKNFLVSGKEGDLTLIKNILQTMSNKGIDIVGPFIIELASKVNGVNISASDIPTEIYNLPANFSKIIALLHGETGSISISELLKVIGIISNAPSNTTTSPNKPTTAAPISTSAVTKLTTPTTTNTPAATKPTSTAPSTNTPSSSPATTKPSSNPVNSCPVIENDSPEWISASNGNVPEGAIVGGQDGEPSYVARVNKDGNIFPGKFLKSYKYAYYGLYGKEETSTTYQILVGCSASWKEYSGGDLSQYSLEAGKGFNEATLYVCRVNHNGVVITGKFNKILDTCFIPYKGEELSFKNNFEILLCCNSDISPNTVNTCPVVKNESPKWVSASNGNVPKGALVGGREGHTLYVARVHNGGKIFPGKFVESYKYAFYNNDQTSKTYQVLVGCSASWKQYKGGKLSHYALEAGKGFFDDTLYVCRVKHNGGLTTGKFNKNLETCYIPYKKEELKFKNNFEILLCCNSA